MDSIAPSCKNYIGVCVTEECSGRGLLDRILPNLPLHTVSARINTVCIQYDGGFFHQDGAVGVLLEWGAGSAQARVHLNYVLKVFCCKKFITDISSLMHPK